MLQGVAELSLCWRLFTLDDDGGGGKSLSVDCAFNSYALN